jgi:hypothetical protein
VQIAELSATLRTHMANEHLQHLAFRKQRSRAFLKLFGRKPVNTFPFHVFSQDDDAYPIDVIVFALDIEGIDTPVMAAVTSGMSDYIIKDMETGAQTRCELIQYFHDCDFEHARRLYDLAWIPLLDEFSIGQYQTIAMPGAVMDGNPLKNALFLPPLLMAHRDFQFEIEKIPVSLLWHVPISDAELKYKKKFGVSALVERMAAVQLPWIFNEAERPPLI